MRVTAATKSATRRRILDAARKLFAEEGFETATTRDIARRAQIAVGTLFNYFPTKESIVLCLVSEAHAQATEVFAREAGARESSGDATVPTLEEELFALVASGLRKLRPYRRFLSPVLESSLTPLADDPEGPAAAFRLVHLEAVSRIAARHGQLVALSALALQLYWTLYTGVLSHWARDTSPRQEDTLALLDQALAMFAGWLAGQAEPRTLNQKGDSSDADDY